AHLHQARDAHVAEPQLAAAVDEALGRLADVDALGDHRLVDVLAASDRPGDRRVAAAALGRHPSGGAERVSGLLWGLGPRLRQAAIAAAGRAGSQELRSQLIRHLSIPASAPHAAAALSASASGVDDLERALLQSGQSHAVRRRILDTLAAIGAPEALHTIAAQLAAPDRALRRRALARLVSRAYRASGAQASLVERAADTLLRDMAGDRAALGRAG